MEHATAEQYHGGKHGFPVTLNLTGFEYVTPKGQSIKVAVCEIGSQV